MTAVPALAPGSGWAERKQTHILKGNKMSMATLEREILAKAKIVLNNPKLKMAGILEWSTGEIKAQNENEVVVRVPDPGVNICVFKVDDKRVAALPNDQAEP